jgi:DNA modification methylase
MKIQISKISERINVRSLKPQGIERLKCKISEIGYLPEKPVLIAPNGDGYTLIDGNHRIAALEELGIETVEALLDETLITRSLKLRRARLANEVSETIVPTTFVDDAELVWRLSDEGMKQTEIGSVLGWGRSKVAQYSRLKDIGTDAWNVIVTHFSETVTNGDAEGVTPHVTSVTFSEFSLRPILSLTPSQQLELVTNLTEGSITKKKFTYQASAYKTRNEMNTYILEQLQGLSEEYTDMASEAVYSGAYDKDWQTDDRPKLTKLIQSLLEEWEQKSGIQLLHGDFNLLVKDILDNSIDMIFHDPPYGISEYGGVTKRGNQIVTADFDGSEDWDTVDPEEFQERLQSWVKEWSRILRPGGAIVTFCDKALISDLWRLFKQYDLIPKNTIVWMKSNPSPAGKARRNLISATEFMIWGVKGGSDYTFNECDDWDKANIIESPLCAGHERIKDAKGETLHPTQKPLRILLPIIEAFSNRGDVIFDGFMGVGSTGKAAKELNRKFIGIEMGDRYFQASQQRLGE